MQRCSYGLFCWTVVRPRSGCNVMACAAMALPLSASRVKRPWTFSLVVPTAERLGSRFFGGSAGTNSLPSLARPSSSGSYAQGSR
jgi:hypothetical protein